MVLFSQSVFADANSDWRVAAENNDADAQFNLGESYYFGENGVEKNIAEAVKWIRKSANLGNANAQYRLGYCYMNGKGVLVMPNTAIKWWYKSADQGQPDAQYMLAIAYERGDGGLKQDSLKAWLLYQEAAKGGNDLAQYVVGRKLYEAHRQDVAVEWLQKSAQQGNKDAKKLIQQISEQ